MVICLERGADLHTAQRMPLPLTVSCFSKIQIGFTFLVPAHPGSPGKGPLNVCVCVCAVAGIQNDCNSRGLHGPVQRLHVRAASQSANSRQQGPSAAQSSKLHSVCLVSRGTSVITATFCMTGSPRYVNHHSYILYAWFPEVRQSSQLHSV